MSLDSHSWEEPAFLEKNTSISQHYKSTAMSLDSHSWQEQVFLEKNTSISEHYK